jgi:hypothetical protein
MTSVTFNLNEISIEYAEAVRAVAAIAGRPPHPDPSEEVARQRLLRVAMTRESDLRCRRDILVGAMARQRDPSPTS